MQSHAIDDRRGIHGTELDCRLAFHLVMVCQVNTERIIWQQRFREVEMKWVRVHYGDASTLGQIPPTI